MKVVTLIKCVWVCVCSSEEFVVTELDGHGQLVSLTSRHIPPAPPPPPAVVKPSKPRPLPSTVPPLSDLVTSDHVRCLQELAEECKSLSQPEGRVELGMIRDAYAVSASDLIGCLGCYDDKERRSLVHVAVRLTYPMLMTQTDRRDEVWATQHDLVARDRHIMLEFLWEF